MKDAQTADVATSRRQQHQTIGELFAGIGTARLKAVGPALPAAEATAPTHAHRAAPESAAGDILIRPFGATVDGLSDAIRQHAGRS